MRALAILIMLAACTHARGGVRGDRSADEETDQVEDQDQDQDQDQAKRAGERERAGEGERTGEGERERERAGEGEPALWAARRRVVASAPPVSGVIAAAVRAAGLDGDPARAAARRARIAGLVPLVSVRAGNTASWREADPDVGRGASVDVRATWRLDRLVFDSRELQAQAMSTARRREKRRLAARVIRAYFTWKRAAMAGAAVRRDEAEAELDAMTDGWFSEARRAASETRTLRATP
jgi:hypothetical protein